MCDTAGRRSLAKTPPLGCPDEKEAAIRPADAQRLSPPPQMRFAYSDLASVLLPESSGDDGVSIQEQLLDKLIKKSLANVEESV